ncbi:MAG: acetylornithine/N-succinyldiaminopimelate aminotransferase, partial [Pseudonocardiales bacterium]|nr:acetylornithine/N-succinyldiaminopimelate aminotransferase [Pseudonocardiales bacterium]
WWGIALHADTAGAVEQAGREHGLLVNADKPDVLRLAPPLIVTEDEVDEALDRLAGALAAVQSALVEAERSAQVLG